MPANKKSPLIEGWAGANNIIQKSEIFGQAENFGGQQ
jgi:hypothetical protein